MLGTFWEGVNLDCPTGYNLNNFKDEKVIGLYKILLEVNIVFTKNIFKSLNKVKSSHKKNDRQWIRMIVPDIFVHNW